MSLALRLRRVAGVLLAGLLFVAVAGLSPAWAQTAAHSLVHEVDPKTGALTVTMRAFNAGSGVYYQVAYRARSGYAGQFGADWGSSLEDRIVPMPDQTVIEVIGGNGGLRQFGQATSEDVERGLEALTNAELGVGGGTPAERAAVKAELAKSRAYRIAITEIYGMQGYFEPGTVFKALYYIEHPNECCGSLTRYDSEWGAKWGDTIRVTYDRFGRIMSREDPSAQQYIGTLDDGRLTSIGYIDRPGCNCPNRHVTFGYWLHGVVADSETGERVSYLKDGKGRLVSVEYGAGKAYRFRYDDRGNIVAIQMDGDVLIFTHDKANRVLTVARESTGVFARYSY